MANALIQTVAGQDVKVEDKNKTSFNLFYDLYPRLNTVDLDTKGLEFTTSFVLPNGELGVGAAYSYTMLHSNINSWLPEFIAYDDFHEITLSLNYNYNLNNNWIVGLGVSPMLTSTFATSLHSNSVVLASQFNIKRKLGQDSKSSYISLGIAYGTEFGAPKIYPTFSYFNSLNDKLSYKIGFPETAFYYSLNTQSKFNFTVAPQSLYTVHNKSIYNNNYIAENESDSYLEFTGLQFNLEYYFTFNSNWSSFFKVGYVSSTAMEIKDIDTDDTIYDFEPDNGFLVGFGLNFNINNN